MTETSTHIYFVSYAWYDDQRGVQVDYEVVAIDRQITCRADVEALRARLGGPSPVKLLSFAHLPGEDEQSYLA